MQNIEVRVNPKVVLDDAAMARIRMQLEQQAEQLVEREERRARREAWHNDHLRGHCIDCRAIEPQVVIRGFNGRTKTA